MVRWAVVWWGVNEREGVREVRMKQRLVQMMERLVEMVERRGWV